MVAHDGNCSRCWELESLLLVLAETVPPLVNVLSSAAAVGETSQPLVEIVESAAAEIRQRRLDRLAEDSG